jgi:hypothetical protein
MIKSYFVSFRNAVYPDVFSFHSLLLPLPTDRTVQQLRHLAFGLRIDAILSLFPDVFPHAERMVSASPTSNTTPQTLSQKHISAAHVLLICFT